MPQDGLFAQGVRVVKEQIKTCTGKRLLHCLDRTLLWYHHDICTENPQKLNSNSNP